MDITLFIDLMQDYGYVAMFLFNWVMLLGIPLPGETAAILSGVVTETGSFYAPLAFLCAYAGLLSSNLFTYFIGRVLAVRILERFEQSRLQNNVLRFRQAFDRYGGYAISFSFFLPGFRMVMPYVTGANRYPLPRYILYAGSASFVWSLIYFQLGRAFPAIYEEVLSELQRYLVIASITVLLGGIGVYMVRQRCLSR
ncbi:DedA family protein [Planococcus lenghuensis]|uniref:Alkaline phosphatase n=1 Tax=Planococcus lenghuensis TaxID=2213202 RepID=A0A1Q2KZD5_9BACL|nr:DedA family protein [Planococcus lenghuensis]AQQ53506.1 alkaline phosphatase [Planococcus lenghuensis]